MKVVIMRGVQGSGKSSWVKNNYPDSIVCSADNFRYKKGIYVYKKEETALVHEQCLKLFATSIVQSPDRTLVVDNTNINVHDMSHYYKLAQAFERKIEIVLIMADPKMAAKRNLHNVPEEAVIYLHNKLITNTLPWDQRLIFSGLFETVVLANQKLPFAQVQ